MFEGEPEWEAVHERDRKDVFDDVVFFLAKKEKEEEKEQRAHNRKLMLQVYNTMSSITYRTTWLEVGFYLCKSDIVVVNTIDAVIEIRDILSRYMTLIVLCKPSRK